MRKYLRNRDGTSGRDQRLPRKHVFESRTRADERQIEQRISPRRRADGQRSGLEAESGEEPARDSDNRNRSMPS